MQSKCLTRSSSSLRQPRLAARDNYCVVAPYNGVSNKVISSKKYSVISALLFSPIVLLLAIGWFMIPVWLSGIKDIATQNYPEGNPDQLVYSEFVVPLGVVLLGTYGLVGLISFLRGLTPKSTFLWRSKAHFCLALLSGVVACVYISCKGLPGIFGITELLFTLLVPLFYSVHFGYLRFYRANSC